MANPESRFDFSAGELPLDFANTWRHELNEPVYSDLVAWSAAAGVLDAGAATELSRMAADRPADATQTAVAALDLGTTLHTVFIAAAAGREPSETALAGLNRALARALPRLRLRHGAGCCSWTWVGTEDALDQMLWPIARAAAELLTSDRLDRVRECASASCSWLFLDSSRNRSRKWCDMASCGNRAKAKRYYRRHRTGVPSNQMSPGAEDTTDG